MSDTDRIGPTRRPARYRLAVQRIADGPRHATLMVFRGIVDTLHPRVPLVEGVTYNGT